MVGYMSLEEQINADFALYQSEGVLPAVDGQSAKRARLRPVARFDDLRKKLGAGG